MKNIFLKTLLLLITLCLAIGMTACGTDGGNDADGGDGTNNGDGGNAVTPPPADEDDPTELTLIKDGVAKFRVVTASGMDGATVKASQEFVSTLRELGVTVDDAVRDGINDKTECEIIVGYGLKNRDEKYVLDPHDYGEDGYGIMIVDNKVLIAGGNATMTKNALSYFQSSVMKISSKTKELTDFSIKRDFTKFKYTDYIIPSVEIGGNSLKGYKLVTELEGMPKEHYGYINELADDIYSATGIYLKSASADELGEEDNYFAIRYVEDAGADGFRAYVDSDLNFIFECSYSNAFSECVKNIVKTQIVDKIGAVTISKSFSKEYHVATVKYSQFGAVGDGVTDDFAAIYNTHVFANQSGQKVIGDTNKTYFIKVFKMTVPVRTDVDWNGASFFLDDTGSEVYAVRNHNLFTVMKDLDPTILTEAEIRKDPNLANATLEQYATSIPFLVPYIKEKSFVFMTNNHKDFIRHGGNISSGQNRLDTVIIDTDGKLNADTPVIWDFEAGSQYLNNGLKKEEVTTPNFTRIEIYSINEKPLTLENGTFYRRVCATVSETGYENVYHSYARGIKIERSNVTMKNITHRLLDEPIVGTSPDGSSYGFDAQGKLKHSYPYGGFFMVSKVYNFSAINCNLSAHTLYWESKSTSSTPVGMGSYDVNFYGSTNINLDGLTNGVDHGDTYYWGIMCSNGCKNFNLKNCVMNRFDAHEGFWNATIVDTTLGYTFNVIGGGELYVEGCERTVGPNFISMRGDYGSTFNGKVTIKDSVFGGKQSYKTKNDPRYGKYYDDYEPLYVFSSGYIVNYKGEYNASEASSFPYLKWDFGYTCYLPQDVVIENLTTGNNSTALYLYNDIGNAAFEKPADFVQPGDDVDRLYYNQYQLTKKITYRNQKTPIQICRDPSSILYTRLASLVRVENTEE